MDLEMTFADQDVIMKLTEDLMRTVFKEVILLHAHQHLSAVLKQLPFIEASSVAVAEVPVVACTSDAFRHAMLICL